MDWDVDKIDTRFIFFPESLDLRAVTGNPSGRSVGGRESGFVFRILVTDGVNGGGIFVTVSPGLPEPSAAVVLLPLSSASTSSSSSSTVAFLPFFTDLRFAGVFFSGDTVIGCSSEWRERYHLQTPLWTPRSPLKASLLRVIGNDEVRLLTDR